MPQCPACGRHTTDPIPQHERRTMELLSTQTHTCEASGLDAATAEQLPIARARRTVDAKAY